MIRHTNAGYKCTTHKISVSLKVWHLCKMLSAPFWYNKTLFMQTRRAKAAETDRRAMVK